MTALALLPGLGLAALLGVGLLGARVNVVQIIALGWQTAAVENLAVLSTLGLAVWLGRRLGLSRAQNVLTGGAVAICGASAARAIAAVLPRHKDSADSRTSLWWWWW